MFFASLEEQAERFEIGRPSCRATHRIGWSAAAFSTGWRWPPARRALRPPLSPRQPPPYPHPRRPPAAPPAISQPARAAETAAPKGESGYTTKLAAYAASLRYEDIPVEV